MRAALLTVFTGVLSCALFLPLPGIADPISSPMPDVTLRLAQVDHPLLLERHLPAGVGCASCHGEGQPTADVPEAVCTGCHGTQEELAARIPFEPNPHRSHMGEVPCTTCHKIHTEQVNLCESCHSFGMTMP